MLSSNGQDSSLVFKLILNHVEFSILVLIFNLGSTRGLVEDFVLDILAILV